MEDSIGDSRRAGYTRVCFLTRRTVPPVNDLSFIDSETVVIVGGQAGGVSDRAIDIDRGATASADQMMMIVADPPLIPGRGSSGLNSAHELFFNQHTERVVHRLPGNRTDDTAHVISHLIRGRVGPRSHRVHDGKPLSCHPHTVLSQ